MASNQGNKTGDAKAIWLAGVEAVDPARLIGEKIRFIAGDKGMMISVEGNGEFLASTRTGDSSLNVHRKHFHFLSWSNRVIVVGAGKASAKMAKKVEEIFEPLIERNLLTGWVNVPDDQVESLQAIHLHGARPSGVNEPTESGVFGSRKIVELLNSAGANDLILCLLSGGGSALLPLPVSDISLLEKLFVTRYLSGAGANIEELNTVRKELSQLKGGGVRRLCAGQRLVTLILSDVLGDPLDVIASGPTHRNPTGPKEALAVLEKFKADSVPELAGICSYIRNKMDRREEKECCGIEPVELVVGNNRTAVEAAAQKARELGYHPYCHCAQRSEQEAERVGEELLADSLDLFGGRIPSHNMIGASSCPEKCDCVISGGEPVVRLVDAKRRGRGGRNQQLVLAALIKQLEGREQGNVFPSVFLSGGTDGEDGPTDAAGAFFDAIVLERTETMLSAPSDYLYRNDAWHFFDECGGLLQTGPTGTNVCDVRVVLK